LCAQFEYKNCRDASQQHHAKAWLPLDQRSGGLRGEEQHHPGTSTDAISKSGLGGLSRKTLPRRWAIADGREVSPVYNGARTTKGWATAAPSVLSYPMLRATSQLLRHLPYKSGPNSSTGRAGVADCWVRTNRTPCTELRVLDSTSSKGVRSGSRSYYCLVAGCWAPVALVAGW
jgi:hypothetical protein